MACDKPYAMIHTETRKRTLVDKPYNLGLSILHDRVLELLTDMGNSVCMCFESGVVCLPKLLKGVFTTVAMDNIDHNLSSVTVSLWWGTESNALEKSSSMTSVWLQVLIDLAQSCIADIS